MSETPDSIAMSATDNHTQLKTYGQASGSINVCQYTVLVKTENSTTNKWTVMKFCSDIVIIDVHIRINPTNFHDPLTYN